MAVGNQKGATVDDDLQEKLDLESPCGQNDEVECKAAYDDCQSALYFGVMMHAGKVVSPWVDTPKEVHPADDTKYQAHQDLEPDQPDVSVVDRLSTVSPPNAPRLLDRRPYCEPSKAEGETPCQRGDYQILFTDIFEHEVGGQQRRHERSFLVSEGLVNLGWRG